MNRESDSSPTTPPPVEVLTRGMISLFSRFAPNTEVGAGGVAMIPNEDEKNSGTTSEEDKSSGSKENGYKDFLGKLRLLSREQPAIVKEISDFFARINEKRVIVTHPVFDDEDIPGCHEEFAPEVRMFISQFARGLLKTTIWKNVKEDEIQALNEHLEKLVLSKIYDSVFAPTEAHHERDQHLSLKIKRLKNVIDPVKHLDMKRALDPRESESIFWEKASEELSKMSNFKSPRDKLICITNACRILVQFIKSCGESPIPDIFLPCLIYVVILANPSELHSNVEYIAAYRNADFLLGESGHFLLHFASAVSFISRADHRALSMTADEFDLAMSHSSFSEKEGKEDYEVDYSTDTAITTRDTPYSAEWYEERFRYENVRFEDLRAADVADLLEQYQQLVRACRHTLSSRDS